LAINHSEIGIIKLSWGHHLVDDAEARDRWLAEDPDFISRERETLCAG